MDFLIQYKELITVLGAFVIEVVVFLVFKKRPKIVDNSFITHLCGWIKEAESKYKVGSDKMNYVLEKSKDYLGDNFIKNEVKSMVEYILTVPEKKEK